MEEFEELWNCHSIIFHYKSISIKQNKNYGKHKSQISDFGLVLSLSLLFLKIVSKAVQNWPISLASFRPLWEIHLRQEAIYSSVPGLYLNASSLVSLPQGYPSDCCLDTLGLKGCQDFILAYRNTTCETTCQMKTKGFSY